MSLVLEPVMNPMCFEDLIHYGGGIRRRILPAQKDESNPLFVPEEPWEGRGVHTPSVWKCPETGKWRMWYLCQRISEKPEKKDRFLAYAESEDGINWKRPEFGIVEFQGNKKNNIITKGSGGCVYLDATAPPSERYRLLVNDTGKFQSDGSINFYVSPDGLHWNLLKERALAIRNDSQSTFLRNPYTGEWDLYHRPGFVVREVTRSRSEDGLNWIGSGSVIAPDEIDRAYTLENYALAVFPYDGGFIGFLKIFANVWYDKRCWLELVVSRDGKEWQRLSDRTPIVPLGEIGEWDCYVMTAGHALVPVDGGHWLYYDCWNARHTGEIQQDHSRGCIGRAFIPTHRLVECLAERNPEAFVETCPVRVKGDTLTLDYEAGSQEIRASIHFEDLTVPEGFSKDDSSALQGQSTTGEIHFSGGSLKQFGRTPIHIAVHMPRGTKLYALGVL